MRRLIAMVALVLLLAVVGWMLFGEDGGVVEFKQQVSVEPVQLVGGVFSLGPYEDGLIEMELPEGADCPNGMPPNQRAGTAVICQGADWNVSLDSTWSNPGVTGVFLRLPWGHVQLAPGTEDRNFDFEILDHELEQAVAHGKYYSLTISAGKRGTPDWLFEEGGVQGYDFQDGGDDLEPGQCGSRYHLGNPTDPAYQARYFDMLRKVFEHIKANDDWYNRLAYVKISGANMITSEARLPNRCQPGCICNTQVWAEAGYTPSGLYDFYLKQMELIQEEMPGKYMGYMLIQGGWPRVNEEGDYLQEDGTSSGGEILNSGKQVTQFIQMASEQFGELFVVSHNGLKQNESSRPNPWVLDASKAGQLTTYQTSNLKHIPDLAGLQSTFVNLEQNTEAHMLEIYEDLVWAAGQNDNLLVSDSEAETNTLDEWNELLKARVE